MQKNHKSSGRNSLRPIILFCVLVFSLIALSLTVRLFFLIRESKVDRAHTFIVSFVYKNDVDIISVASELKKLSHISIRGEGSSVEKMQLSGVLPDETILIQKPFKDFHKTSSYFFDAAFHRGDLESSLTFYDLLRLAIRVQGISPSSMSSDSIKIPADENRIDMLISRAIIDESLTEDNKTISIVNATGVSGLGTKIGRVFSNMGLSVVSVSNGESVKATSELKYFSHKNYTAERLGSLLELIAQQESKQGLSDIILILGKDKSTIFSK